MSTDPLSALWDRIQDLAEARAFAELDALVRATDVTAADPAAIIAPLSYSYAMRGALPSWLPTVARVADELERRGLDASHERRWLAEAQMTREMDARLSRVWGSLSGPAPDPRWDGTPVALPPLSLKEEKAARAAREAAAEEDA